MTVIDITKKNREFIIMTSTTRLKSNFLIVAILFLFLTAHSQEPTDLINKNKPERELWLKNAGFGMFIHWGIDTQLGTVISHSLVGASDDYIDRYISQLPKTFNPTDWDADKIAILAKNAGMKYIVFTAKHHSGFCFWDTKTTDFNVSNTPYQKDIVKSLVDACRKWGLAIGIYYSSEDFVYAHQHGMEEINRVNHWADAKAFHADYSKYILDQTRELMTNFGPIDMFFLDSQVMLNEVKDLVWELQPSCLITRGAILTPEQYIPGAQYDQAWESNMTMGTQWNYKPTNEHYKSGTALINLLIEARAKGGTYLLNIGPDQWGGLNEGQQGRLMEIAAWNLVNAEAVTDVRPWIVSNEENIWFSKHKSTNTVYAYITGMEDWIRGDRKEFVLKSISGTAKTKISVLGQSGNIVEYNPGLDGKSYVENTPEGLKISVVRAQRIYNNHRWPNAIVVKLENVKKAFDPVVFKTLPLEIAKDRTVTFNVELENSKKAESLILGWEYRPTKSTLDKGPAPSWIETNRVTIDKAGKYSIMVSDPILDQNLPEVIAAENGVVNASFSQKGIEYRAFVIQRGVKINAGLLKLN